MASTMEEAELEAAARFARIARAAEERAAAAHRNGAGATIQLLQQRGEAAALTHAVPTVTASAAASVAPVVYIPKSRRTELTNGMHEDTGSVKNTTLTQTTPSQPSDARSHSSTSQTGMNDSKMDISRNGSTRDAEFLRGPDRVSTSERDRERESGSYREKDSDRQRGSQSERGASDIERNRVNRRSRSRSRERYSDTQHSSSRYTDRDRGSGREPSRDTRNDETYIPRERIDRYPDSTRQADRSNANATSGTNRMGGGNTGRNDSSANARVQPRQGVEDVRGTTSGVRTQPINAAATTTHTNGNPSSSAHSSVSLQQATLKQKDVAPMYTYHDDNVDISKRMLEIEEAKKAYLGIPSSKNESKRRAGAVRSGDTKIKGFLFEWDAKDDTSTDVNELYQHRLQPSLAFGRGYLGGIDKREQRKASNYMDQVSKLRRTDEDGVDATGTAEQRRETPAMAMDMESSAKRSHSSTQASSNTRGMGMERAPGSEDGVAAKALPGSHWSEKKLSDMTDRDWRIMREDFDILVRGGRAVNPLRSWDECPMPAPLRQAIDAMGYVAPSNIQRQAIPMGLAGRDLIGVAETGSGKTAAFLIPLLSYVLEQPQSVRDKVAESGPLALIMAPTRELAQQIDEEAKKLSRFTDVRTCCVVGGVSIAEQGVKMRQGVDIVIGTPGRLIDTLENRFLVLHQCRYIVLDEADRMIDLGFEPQVTAVMDSMPVEHRVDDQTNAPAADMIVSSATSAERAHRTTHMFSATFPPEVQKLARKYMHSPATVQIGDQDTGKNKRIAQEVIYLPSESRKRTKLVEILSNCPRPVIVFVNAKKQCDVVGRDLEGKGFSCTVLHSGKTQDIREDALAAFKAGDFEILIATDVAGRGLDIPDVAQVINYDMPSEIDRYQHRIGRTGRAGKSGKAVTFVTDEDAQILPALVAYLTSTGQTVSNELAQKASGKDRDRVQYAKK